MIYHTNHGNCHTDKIARACARQAGPLEAVGGPASSEAGEPFCGFLSEATRGCLTGLKWVG